MAGMLASAMISGSLNGTLIMIAGIVAIVPMLFSLLNKDSAGWVVVVVLIALLLFNFGGWLTFIIGKIVLGLFVIYFPIDDLAYNYGNYRGCKKNKNSKRLTRAISGVVSDACLIGAGACLALCSFIGLCYTIGGVLGYIALVAYIVKLVMNIVCEDFRN